MKILILSNVEAGGEWIAMQTLLEKIKRKNSQIRLYMITYTSEKQLIKESLFDKIIYIKHVHRDKPLKYYRELICRLIEGVKIINKLFEKHKFNSVIAIDYVLALSYAISQKRLDYIYYFHGIKNDYRIFNDTFNHYMIFKKLLEIFSWILSKKIIVPSIKAKNYLIDNYYFFLKKMILIVPNLIRDEFKVRYLTKTNTKKAKNILYSGRLDQNKGIKNLIYAFLKLESKFSKFTLTLAYFGKPNVGLLNMINNLINKGKNIKLLYDLKVIELARLYQTSYFGILPSVFETSSLFFKESLESKLPIFITNVGDVVEISPNMFILKNNDINTINNKMVDFCQNTNKYSQSAKIMFKKWKKEYDEDKIIAIFLQAIKT